MKFITFIWIPKCAGTTIQNYYNLERQICKTKSSNYNFKNNKSVTFGHADINIILKKNIISNIFYKNSFKFCIVRNPYDRIVSLFHYQKKNKMFNKSPNFIDLSFDLWIKYLYENRNNIPKSNDTNYTKNKLINNQWNLMCSWIPKDIDKIYYFENGIENIINDINININNNIKVINLKHYNKTDHINYKYYYKNKLTQEYVYKIYEKDFITFNYPKKI